MTDSFSNLAASLTIHGVPKIARNNQILVKLLWSISFIISFASCIYYITVEVNSFLEYPYITNIYTVYETKPGFPLVTVCYEGNSANYRVYKCYFNKLDCMPHLVEVNEGCFSFNRGLNNNNEKVTVLYSKEIGYEYGLQLILYNSDQSSYFSAFISNSTQRANNENAIKFTNKVEKNIELRRVIDTKLNAPYSNCLHEVVFPKVNIQ